MVRTKLIASIVPWNTYITQHRAADTMNLPKHNRQPSDPADGNVRLEGYCSEMKRMAPSSREYCGAFHRHHHLPAHTTWFTADRTKDIHMDSTTLQYLETLQYLRLSRVDSPGCRWPGGHRCSRRKCRRCSWSIRRGIWVAEEPNARDRHVSLISRHGIDRTLVLGGTQRAHYVMG